MADLTGKTLDRYEIIERIGEGGMAAVYRGRQPRLKRDVAVKVMLPLLAADATFRERFEREAQAVANLRHPNILTVHDYGETDDGQLYLVVEYVPGGALRDKLTGPLPPEMALSLVAQVADALDYAHQQGLVHRDVKPNNILLTQDGRPLLADFGLTRPIQSDRRITASGMMVGTPDYVSPEQAQGLDVDGRSDIYALGVMLFEMLTGKHPYTGETPISVMIKHISEPMPRPSELNPHVSPELDEIVIRATAKAPADRYQRAGDMARALRAALSPESAPATISQAAPAPPTFSSQPARPPQTGWDGSLAPDPAPRQSTIRASGSARLAKWIRWAALVGVLLLAAAVLFFVLKKEPAKEKTGMIPTAKPNETMILIAEFKAEAGAESYDVSQRIYDKLAADLREYGETGVLVYQVDEVIESSQAAVALGQQHNATTVIWGYYDDIGISPNVEAVGALKADDLSLRLERFNLDTGEAVNFKLYIAKGLPEELSFLTAVSLYQAFILQGDTAKAIRYLVMAENNLPDEPQFRGSGAMVYFTQAILAFLLEQPERAAGYMDQAIDHDSANPLFYTSRAINYAQMGQTDLALADLERAIDRDPDYLLAFTIEGILYWHLGELDKAQQVFRQSLEINPNDTAAYYALAILAFEAGDGDAALKVWASLQDVSPNDLYLPVFRALLYEKLGYASKAAEDYALALELNTPPDASIEYVRFVVGKDGIPAYSYLFECAAFYALQDFSQAAASCSKSLAVDADYFDARWKRGQIYAAQGEWELALADYDAALELDANWPWVYYLRAQALIALGQLEAAQADLTRALQLNPVDELREQINALR